MQFKQGTLIIRKEEHKVFVVFLSHHEGIPLQQAWSKNACILGPALHGD